MTVIVSAIVSERESESVNVIVKGRGGGGDLAQLHVRSVAPAHAPEIDAGDTAHVPDPAHAKAGNTHTSRRGTAIVSDLVRGMVVVDRPSAGLTV